MRINETNLSALNEVNRVANRYEPELHRISQTFAGKKARKVDGSLTKAFLDALAPTLSKIRSICKYSHIDTSYSSRVYLTIKTSHMDERSISHYASTSITIARFHPWEDKQTLLPSEFTPTKRKTNWKLESIRRTEAAIDKADSKLRSLKSKLPVISAH